MDQYEEASLCGRFAFSARQVEEDNQDAGVDDEGEEADNRKHISTYELAGQRQNAQLRKIFR